MTDIFFLTINNAVCISDERGKRASSYIQIVAAACHGAQRSVSTLIHMKALE